MRGVPRQRDFVNAFPDANSLFGRLETRGLLRQIQAPALGGLSLLMPEPRSEIHHRIFGRGRGRSSHAGAWLVLIHELLPISELTVTCLASCEGESSIPR